MMHRTLLILCCLPVLSAGGDDKGTPAQAGGAKEPPKLSALEKKFQDALENVVFTGRWRLVEGGKLGEEAEDKYTIRSASKVAEDTWLIHARIQYGGKDVAVPVPVKVYWAGDTPVISITSAGIPGLGTYTARVLVHEGLYTGTWSGPGHGGFLSGVITKAGGAKPDEKPAKGTEGGDPGKGAEKGGGK